MGQAITISNLDHSAADLRRLMSRQKDGAVVRRRCIDLRDKVEQHFCVKVHKRTVAKWLHRLELTRLQPRPFHPKKDAAAQEAFKKTSAT